MIDAAAELLSYLLSQEALTDRVDDRIWAERSEPIIEYRPSDGSGIVFKTRGGTVDYSGSIMTHSWQFKCYGVDEQEANETYRILASVLHEAQSYPMLWAEIEVVGQTLAELRPRWLYVLSYFTTKMFMFPVEA